MLLITSALLPRILNVLTGYVRPALQRLLVKPYTQEHQAQLSRNQEFNVARATAEAALLTMHTLTFSTAIPIMLPLCALSLMLIVFDTKLKLKYMWSLPKRASAQCGELFLSIVKAMVFVHILVAIYQLSYYRTWGQVAGMLFAVHACSIAVGRCRLPNLWQSCLLLHRPSLRNSQHHRHQVDARCDCRR